MRTNLAVNAFQGGKSVAIFHPCMTVNCGSYVAESGAICRDCGDEIKSLQMGWTEVNRIGAALVFFILFMTLFVGFGFYLYEQGVFKWLTTSI